MKLTPQQIQFIDNYLGNSGMRYLDARAEMTDHVASALEGREGDFYENFKAYMIQNKKDLLTQYGTFKNTAWKKGLGVVGYNVFSLWFVLAVVALVLLNYTAADYFDEATLINSYRIMALFSGAVYLVSTTFYKVFNKWSFSIIEQPFGLFIFINLMNIRPFIEELIPAVIHDSVITVFSISATVSLYKIFYRYKKRYVQNLKYS
ncbi:hypothetical protein CHU92_12945 [Flavobacterium cyanobacteriorum]|uniref:Uncharacterized protein n=1 Tax=Flavobacterium cyanobacteriorum TaxID=2022802 RepID=A0A255YX74_9FLAO|nr:hypothetical protein [Flavobacterium cyanobacteriorum]OYQ33294.1 hypothetical protein CHU92_12945 [Flavobacterium cyanobacteriorum]